MKKIQKKLACNFNMAEGFNANKRQGKTRICNGEYPAETSAEFCEDDAYGIDDDITQGRDHNHVHSSEIKIEPCEVVVRDDVSQSDDEAILTSNNPNGYGSVILVNEKYNRPILSFSDDDSSKEIDHDDEDEETEQYESKTFDDNDDSPDCGTKYHNIIIKWQPVAKRHIYVAKLFENCIWTQRSSIQQPHLDIFSIMTSQSFHSTMPIYNVSGINIPTFKTTNFDTRHYSMCISGKKLKMKKFHTTHNTSSLPIKSQDNTILHKAYIAEEPESLKLLQPPVVEAEFNLEVASDGRVSDEIGDPPGQQSVYIVPGDIRSEAYRLSTFENYPATCPLSRNGLAKAGFYFTGFFDRVKCFACARTVEQWGERDDPSHLRWHKIDCPFPRGEPCGNNPVRSLFNNLNFNQGQANAAQQNHYSPTRGAARTPEDVPERLRRNVILQNGISQAPSSSVGNPASPAQPRTFRMANVVSSNHRRFLTNLHLNRELDRLTSFSRWNIHRPSVSPTSLARSGFFYLGDLDRTQCFSCGGVLRNWTREDEPAEEHRTHFPTCQMVLGTEARNIKVPEGHETQVELKTKYPCQYPANPHMRTKEYRLGTFDQRWPSHRIRATPDQIAEAGFFFLGERDRVKCWYCNGGLQNWEADDVPWDEHAKWFPNCQFLLQNKGQVTVYRHLALNSHLARPIIAKQEGSPLESACGNEEIVRPADIPPGGARITQPSPPPIIIDPQAELRKKQERLDRIMETSEVVKNVIAFGYAERIVRQLLEEKINAGTEDNPDDIYGSMSSLLDDVMKKEAEQVEEEAMEPEVAEVEPVSNNFSSMSSNFSQYSSIGPMSSIGRSPVSSYIGVSGFDNDDEELSDIYSTSEPPSVQGAATIGAPKPSSSNQATNVGQPDDPESMQELLTKIEDERNCKICFTNVADIVFIPCSHMCCCMDCTKSIRQCPVCRTKIEKAIKTYTK